MRVCINPIYSPTDQTEGGIRRVVDAMVKYFPEFDITPTANPDGADLIVNHGTYNVQRPGVPSIAACHGLYWAGYDWPAWAAHANRAVTDTMIAADAITVPSVWVGQAVTRGLWRPVHPIYHGVEADEWEPVQSRGYVLWNKARTDPVSNHNDLDRVAELLPEVPFVTTYGTPRTNVRVIGPQPYDIMKKLVTAAGVYLATPRETFGIGTIEALAAGVPIAGWRFGGQEEIVVEHETGYLADYGDFDSLAQCISNVLHERRRLSANAYMDARARWTWRDKIQDYAELFHSVVAQHTSARPRVSVVVTCYNLGKYVTHCLESLAEQSVGTRGWECIVVDDRSTDNSLDIIKESVEYLKGRGPFQFKVVQPPRNLGLSGARNFGAAIARGKYLLFLDADDMLTTNAIASMADHLDRHPELDIAFGRLDTMAEDGTQRARNPWPNGAFDYAHQMAHQNQFSYSSMMRYRVWKNLGGYRTRDWRAEDAGFWCRATSFGYHAGPATNDATLIYRVRPDSKSGQERSEHADVDGDWTAWFPWRLGATSGPHGTELLKQQPPPVLNTKLVPFGAQGKPPRGAPMWDVRHHQDPTVSIIVPVGPGHAPYVVDALDSIMAQTCPSWEAIVVYDNSNPLPTAEFPWARFMYTGGGIIPPYEPKGAGAARNTGLKVARAPLVLFLDGDDVLVPQALEKMLSIYAASGGYVYSDTLGVPGNITVTDVIAQDWRTFPTLTRGTTLDRPSIIPAAEWSQAEFLRSGYDGHPGAHSVTALVATVDARGVGGFDEVMIALEDWEFYLRLAASGITGHLIPEPLLVYRMATGLRREARHAQQTALEARIRARYAPFTTGEKPMCACGGGGGGPQAQSRAAAALADLLPANFDTSLLEAPADLGTMAHHREGQRIRMRYVGDRYGAVPYKGKVSHEVYRAGQDPGFIAIDADPRDVEGLLLTGVFKVVEL